MEINLFIILLSNKGNESVISVLNSYLIVCCLFKIDFMVIEVYVWVR